MFIKSIATATLAVSFAGAAVAEEKKSASFLSTTPEGQIAYITTSLSMAQALLSKSQSDCISKWATAHRPDGYKEIVDTVKKYDTFHPSAVIAAVIEKTCGAFELAQR